ncbi:MAG TPA: metallophosphoesterase [Planctomycetota bacterium]|jgi:hypothetical protein
MTQPRQLSRRQLLKLSASALLTAGLWPGRLKAEGDGAAADFWFCVANDLHFLDEKCAPFFENVVSKMKGTGKKLEFCLLAGDLADIGREKPLTGLRDAFKVLDIPLHAVPGNHDWHEAADRTPYEQVFPKQLNYSVEYKSWQVIGLDSTENKRVQNTNIQPDTFRWLTQALPKLDKTRPMIVFTHFPLAPGAKMRPVNADELLGQFKEYNLQAVFCGHYHGFTESKLSQCVITTNRCCSRLRSNHDNTKEKGFFLCHAKDGHLEREFVQVNQVQGRGDAENKGAGPGT